MGRAKLIMKRLVHILVIAVVVAFSTFPLGCAGAYVGVSVPMGYYPYGGRGPYGGRPYGGWGPSVGVTVPLGRPARY